MIFIYIILNLINSWDKVIRFCEKSKVIVEKLLNNFSKFPVFLGGQSDEEFTFFSEHFDCWCNINRALFNTFGQLYKFLHVIQSD